MVHLIASIGFSVLTLAVLGYIAMTLILSSDAILVALGVNRMPVERRPHHPVRVRSAGRWQSVQTASPQPKRAAA